MSRPPHATALQWLSVLTLTGLLLTTEARAAEAERWKDDVLYFVVLDRFANGNPRNDVAVDRASKGAFHGGDLAGLTQRLDALADLGVTALWITPLVKNIDGFVTGAGFPDWGYHGYWADDFTLLDPRFGTLAELRALVKAAHARKMKVLLDVVYNHAGYGSQYLTNPRTKDWLRSGDACGKDDVTACLAGLPDFKTERPEVAKFLLDAQLGWAKRSGIDGFRLDTVKHLDHAFWQLHRERVRKELAPGFFLLGEVWGGDEERLDPWFERDELDAGFDFSFQGSVIAFLQGRGRTVAFDRYLAGRHRVREGHLLAHFLSSHDVPGALFQLGGDVEAFKLAAVLQLTTLGLPTLYYGEEVGRLGGAWPENRSDMPEHGDAALRAFYKKLIATRRAHPALWRGTHRGVATDGEVYAYARQDARAKDGVIVVVNRGKLPGRVSLEPLPEWGAREIVDALGGGAVPRKERLEVEVAPRSALILTAREREVVWPE